MKLQAFVYDSLESGDLICGTCRRRCVIAPGESGWCGTRKNEGGELYNDTYGEVASISVNPIEQDPVYHFLPGSRWLTVGSVGCNFRCPGCENWERSHWSHGSSDTRYVSPEELIEESKARNCDGISWTSNEPAMWFEYTLDAAARAKARDLSTAYITNGFISRDAFELIAPFLDIYRVDIKAFSDETYKTIGHIENCREVFEQTEIAREYGLHVEVVTNIVPGINDQPAELHAIAAWIAKSLGPETPWHITRFFPHHEWSDLTPTPLTTLENAWTLGKDAGLWYVYLGNVSGHAWGNTCCHNCGGSLIQRSDLEILENRITDGRCPDCNTSIPGRF